MTETRELQWIKSNLGSFIRQALAINTKLAYTEDWLAAIAMRETGELIGKGLDAGFNFQTICGRMRGDFTQRPGDPQKCYHGYSFWQIDIGSFPDFIKSGDWTDPFKSCMKAISTLEGKRMYITTKAPQLAGDQLDRAVTAAYNNGEGNEMKDIINGQDLDARTTGHNYSAEVWRFRELYKTL